MSLLPERRHHIDVAFEKPANAEVLRHLRGRPSVPVARNSTACSPESVLDPYRNLGTHPDMVSWLWDEITRTLPVRCRWIVYGAPALVRPDTGIIFGFAGGTYTYALRLPPTERAELTTTAARLAEAWADHFALRGHDRDRYLRAHAGDVHEYSGGSTFDVSTLGKDWAFGRWLEGEATWCLAAYRHAV
jgi:hypothetical protein